jgi:hypothetical protein
MPTASTPACSGSANNAAARATAVSGETRPPRYWSALRGNWRAEASLVMLKHRSSAQQVRSLAPLPLGQANACALAWRAPAGRLLSLNASLSRELVMQRAL